MKRIHGLIRSILIILIIIPGAVGSATGRIDDAIRLAYYEDSNGQRLSSLILPFRQYDRRKHKVESVKVRVTVIGCVNLPGVYDIDETTTVGTILEGSQPVKNHPASAFNKVVLYRKNNETKTLNRYASTDMAMFCEDGDVINVQAVTL